MMYLLWSKDWKQWWMTRGQGYTTEISQAGFFTEETAKRVEETSRPKGAGRTIAVPVELLSQTFVDEQLLHE